MNRTMVLLVMVLGLATLLTASTAFAQDDGLAPVPATAFDPDVDLSNGFHVGDLGDGLYWLTEGSYQVIFAATGEGVVIVDAPPSIGENILAAVATVTDEPITHVIYSHSHGDHIAAAGIYPADATYIAHEDTAAQLAREGNYPFGAFLGGGPVPAPTETFSDSMTLEVGSQVFELDYRGVNHEPGNIYIYAPQQKVLMLVDVIFPGWVPFKDLALAEDVPGYFAAHDEVLSYDFDVYVGGHLTRLGTREDVEMQQEYMLEMQAASATAFQTIDFFAIAEETGFENQWLLFDTYLGAVAQSCADAVTPNWVDRLGAADIWTYDHCWKIMESLRID